MNRFGRPLFWFAAVALAAIGITGALAGPGGALRGGSDEPPPAPRSVGVVSPDGLLAASDASPDGDGHVEVVGDAIECPSGETGHFKFEAEGDEFEVTGLLVSLDAATVVVTGPDGDVVAAMDGATEVKGDPQPDDPVRVEGSILTDGSFLAREVKPACEDEVDDRDVDGDEDVDDDDGDGDEHEVVGEVIPCASGEDTRFKFEAEGDEFEVKGLLVSLDGATVVVTGPDGDVAAAVDGATEVKGDPQPGDPVKVEGSVLGDGSFLAREVEPGCDGDHGHDDGDVDGDEIDDHAAGDGDHDDHHKDVDDHDDGDDHEGSHHDEDDGS